MEDNVVITRIQKVLMIDRASHPNKTQSYGKVIHYHELIYRLSGEIVVYFGDEILEEKAGTVRFLPQGTTTRYDVVRTENGDCIDVFFETDRPLSERAFVASLHENRNIAAQFRRLFALWVAQEEGYYYEAISILYSILAGMQKKHYIPESKYMLIAPAVEEIRNHFYDPNFSVLSLAGKCNISYSYLKRVFIERFGTTPRKYVIQLRVNYACELLKQDELSIHDIAILCGFSDEYYFSRLFKSVNGVAPSSYRKLCENTVNTNQKNSSHKKQENIMA